MRVEVLRTKDIELGVQFSRGMGFDLYFTTGHILDELKDTFFQFCGIVDIFDLILQLPAIVFFRRLPVANGLQQQSLTLVFCKNGIDVDSDKHADLRHVLQVGTDAEVATGTKIAHQCVEVRDLRIVLEYALEFLEQRFLPVVGKKFGDH